MFKLFKKKDTTDREIKNLLRENLSTLVVDMFYTDDPLMGMNEAERKRYLKKFKDIMTDKVLMQRIKWLINKQARMIVNDTKNERESSPGAMTINGMSVIMEDIERLSVMHDKEVNQAILLEGMDRFKVL